MDIDAVDGAVRTLAQQVSDGHTMPDVVLGELSLGVRILVDTSSHPSDSDEYGPADLETFQNGEWRFVGLRAVAKRGLVEVTSSGVWAVELGRTEGDIETTYLADIIRGELAEITDDLTDLRAALTGEGVPR